MAMPPASTATGVHRERSNAACRGGVVAEGSAGIARHEVIEPDVSYGQEALNRLRCLRDRVDDKERVASTTREGTLACEH